MFPRLLKMVCRARSNAFTVAALEIVHRFAAHSGAEARGGAQLRARLISRQAKLAS